MPATLAAPAPTAPAHAAAGPLAADAVTRFHRDGLLLGPIVLDRATVAELLDELERVVRDQHGPGPQPLSLTNFTGRDDAPLWQIVNIWQASPAFARLVHHPVITAAAAQLLGAHELRLWHDQIQYKPANNGGANPWHQDLPYWPVLSGERQLTAWVALDDADEANGCMSMVPGSHQWGEHIRALEALPDFTMPADFLGHHTPAVRCPVPAGAVHFHHSLTWHGSPINTSGRPRRAIALHYMTADTKYSAQGNHLMKPAITSHDGEPIDGAPFLTVWRA
jgi:ectoine hydroxylase-related dioxygenase (phytanoyl-CoA dioxygenase family)